MIIFHEGLPRSGKSYEALVMHIVPSLQAGRRVLTNIEGINFDKIADLTELPAPVVREFLVCCSNDHVADKEKRFEAQKADILRLTQKDSIVIIDEIQDLHPTERQKLSPVWSDYITTHGHRGLDIVLMGQDRRDVHTTWRRRIQRVVTFNKLSAVGADNSYCWEVHEATKPEKFKLVSSGTRKYDSKYFGAYKSHEDGTKNKGNYKDDRANLLKNPKLRYAAIFFVLLAWFSISKAVDFFTPEEITDDQAINPAPLAPAEASDATPAQEIESQPPVMPAQPQKAAEPQEPPPLDVFDEYARKNRLRLTGYMVNSKTGDFVARIDILNSSGHRLDEYSVVQLQDMGWQVTLRESGLHLVKSDRQYLARPWPLDTVRGQVDRTTTQSLSARHY